MDDWPKPELLYALTPFEVLAGLRTPADAAALLRALDVDQLQPLAAALDAAAPGCQALARPDSARSCGWPTPGPAAALVATWSAACARLAPGGGPTRTPAPRPSGWPRIIPVTSAWSPCC